MGTGISYPCCSNESHNSQFRSEQMSLCQLFLQSEAAYSVIRELGELGLIEFKDLNPEQTAFQRKFVNEVRLCDEMDRILRFLDGELTKDGIKPAPLTDIPSAPEAKEMRDLHTELSKLEGDLRDVNSNRQQLRSNLLELSELQIVLSASHTFLEEATFESRSSAVNSGYDNGRSAPPDIEMGDKRDEYNSMKLNFITGTILSGRLIAFERMLWFACRGNVYLRYTEISQELEDPVSGNPMRKAVFCLFFQGEQLKIKAKKICEGFRCNIYTIPKSAQERTDMSGGLSQRVGDITMVLQKSDDHRHRMLLSAADTVRSLIVKVLKTKAIYHTMNMFNMDVTQKCLIAECWCPVRDLEKIHHAIQLGTEKSGSEVDSILNTVESHETIPTFNRTNKFTNAFQTIVNAYGISRYQEINPALFTVVTFPFIFAIMFGDCAHGFVMFGFALWMVLSEKKFLSQKGDNEIWNIIFGGRYIVLLMGLFSIYTGFIYNDFFSKSVDLFGSEWSVNYETEDPDKPPHQHFLSLNTSDRNYDVYPIGLDPIWMISINKITFINSYKMKMSIIVGVLQMVFGLSLSLMNHIYFRKWINIFCEFIPEVIFLLSIFGYMVVLIIAKWVLQFENTSCAPGILVGFITMFLFSYDHNDVCNENYFYENLKQQEQVQTILVLLVGVCLPWLLIAKPLVLGIQRCLSSKRNVGQGIAHQRHVDPPTFTDIENTEASNSQPVSTPVDHEEEPFGEIIVHQCIHTIEYCLGCVSNTASYLRLWALSLAHAQLSEVLWNMVLKNGLSANSGWVGAPVIIIVFPPFAVLTVCVLLLMEGLSAFLHALRLHWVEFNSKFFYGDGIKFIPFTFKKIVAENRN